MRKPNAILHMTGYGCVYGLLLGMLYIWGFFILSGELTASLGAIAWTGYFAFIFGALPGAVLGFVEGIILWFLTHELSFPTGYFQFAYIRKLAMGIMGGLTFLGMGVVMWSLFGFFWISAIFPPFIAMLAAVYAVHRYMLKLEAWGNLGKAKHKAKHLPNNQLTDDDHSAADNLIADESKSQVQNIRR